MPSLGAPWWIEDRYIDGTTLRLRQLTAEGETVHELPSWLGDEVTHDDRYSGGRLARMSTIEVETLLNSAH